MQDAPAIVRKQHERRAARAAGVRVDRDLADAAANRLNASRAGMANALESNMAPEGEDASPAGPNDHRLTAPSEDER